MAKSGFVVGGVVGATAIILLFAFIIVPSQEIGTPELITSNGHSTTILGDEASYSSKNNLSLIQLFEKSEEGVVQIQVDRDGQNTGGVGSGFVYDNLGHIITNAHVVDGASKAIVTFLDGSQYNAEIIGKDKFTDIAVIKVSEKPRLLHPLQIGDSSQLHVGEQVAAIGNPYGLSGSMTSGIVSGLGRTITAYPDSAFSIPDVIQTDAAINPGNSGGPLLNLRGEVVGINTAIQSRSGEFSGVGYAVPSNTAIKIVPSLIEDGEYRHPWIGISGRDIDPDLARVLDLKDAKGFLVITVVDGSPADKAGLKGMSETQVIDGKEYPADGDIIISVDDKEVRKISDILIHLQREKSVGDTMSLGILRDGEFMHISLELVERPDL